MELMALRDFWVKIAQRASPIIDLCSVIFVAHSVDLVTFFQIQFYQMEILVA